MATSLMTMKLVSAAAATLIFSCIPVQGFRLQQEIATCNPLFIPSGQTCSWRQGCFAHATRAEYQSSVTYRFRPLSFARYTARSAAVTKARTFGKGLSCECVAPPIEASTEMDWPSAMS